MNWIDLIIITVLVFFTVEAWGSPLLSEILDLVSFLLALLLSFRYYNLAATFFETQFDIPHGLTLAMGFMTVWFLAEAVFYLIVKLTVKLVLKNTAQPQGAAGLLTNRYLSVIPAILRGIIFISLILVVLATFPIQPVVKKAVQDSKIGSLLLKKAYQLEAPIKQVFGGVTQDSLTFLTIKPQTNERIDLGFQIAKFSSDPLSEIAMIELINKERGAIGATPLTFDANLQSVARAHSEDMFKRGYFSHYSPEGESVADRADHSNIKYLAIGENLAYAPTLELAHHGLMNSEGHRGNILSADFGKIGIGVVDGGVYGKMFTQVFSN